MRTEQLWECLAAICVHKALTMYRWCVLTDRLLLVGKKARETVLVILAGFMAILTGNCLSCDDDC